MEQVVCFDCRVGVTQLPLTRLSIHVNIVRPETGHPAAMGSARLLGRLIVEETCCGVTSR
jgi:hypothetical protein